MYIIHFFKRLFSSANIPILIYLILNIAIITTVFYWSMGEYYELWIIVVISIALYLISMTIALSPFGEWLLRLINKCKRIKEPDVISYLEPIFNEVRARAIELDSNVPKDIRLYIKEDTVLNAFAIGRKTICLTDDMIKENEDSIRAAIAHEFGHLAHKDTDLILLISVGNFIVIGIVVVFRLIILLWQLVAIIVEFILSTRGLIAILTGILTDVFVIGFMWIWTKIGVLLVMKSSRDNEYLADEFAFNLGYGEELCVLIDSFYEDIHGKGLFASLAKSHPKKEDRIARLKELGARYM